MKKVKEVTVRTNIPKPFVNSVKGKIHGQVELGGNSYVWSQWDGEKCKSKLLAFDTETELIVAGKVPRLAVAQVYDGTDRVFLIHSDDIARFVDIHTSCNFICHNTAFDFHVVYRHLITFKTT